MENAQTPVTPFTACGLRNVRRRDLTRDVPETGLRAGDVGTVVDRHAIAGVSEDGYSVEFFDMTGNTVAVVMLPGERPPYADLADCPAVRALSA